MKELLSFIVSSIVSNPEAISIDEQREEGNLNLNLTVDTKDMGIVIGKNGQIIRAIRKLLTVRAIAENVRVNLQLVEPSGEPKVESQESSENPKQ